MAEPKSSPETVPAFSCPWEKNSNSIWLATTLALHRNIDKFNFPHRLDAEKRGLVLELLTGAVKTVPTFSSLKYYPADEIAPIDREFLAEHFLIFEAPRDSQHGRAYITEPDGKVLIQINANDHLEIYAIETSQELEKALAHIVLIERGVEKHLPFAFSHQFGYLTTDPCQSGTGLLVHAYIHIPALVQCGGYHDILSKEKHEGLIITSLQGNPEDLVGDLLVLRNRWTTGVTEETILSAIRNTALKITADEQLLRTRIVSDRDDAIVDHVSRAIGTLRHSFTIDTSEALRALSLVKFGVELGWIQGITLETINQLFFDCRRAHLARNTDVTLYGRPELYKRRALMLRQAMATVALV